MRPSGTEDIIRIYAESSSIENVNQIIKLVSETILNEFNYVLNIFPLHAANKYRRDYDQVARIASRDGDQ